MNKELKTIDFKGKAYVTVNERLKYFRENFKDWKLVTDVIELNEKRVVLKASILNPKNEVVATGLSCEVNGNGFVNKTSYVENSETSAWGRALGNLGIGIDSSVASADEVANAIIQQNNDTRNKLKQVVDSENEETAKMLNEKKTKQFNEYKEELGACEELDQLNIYWQTINQKIHYLGAERKQFLIDLKNELKEKFEKVS